MRSVVPAGYDELNWPNSAALDLPVVDHLLRDGVDGQIDTAMMHFDEAGEHQWRFRVYHRGRALAISDLLPLLDQIGFRSIDERSFEFASAGASVWVHDVGVEVSDADLLYAGARDEVQRLFAAAPVGRSAGAVVSDTAVHLAVAGLGGSQIDDAPAACRSTLLGQQALAGTGTA